MHAGTEAHQACKHISMPNTQGCQSPKRISKPSMRMQSCQVRDLADSENPVDLLLIAPMQSNFKP